MSQKHKCTVCGYIYNPDEGDPDTKIPAGTEFKDLLDNWICPICGASKLEFEPIE